MKILFFIFCCPVQTRMEKPFLENNLIARNPLIRSVARVAPLPDRQAVIKNYIHSNKTNQIMKINSDGEVVQVGHFGAVVTLLDFYETLGYCL